MTTNEKQKIREFLTELETFYRRRRIPAVRDFLEDNNLCLYHEIDKLRTILKSVEVSDVSK